MTAELDLTAAIEAGARAVLMHSQGDVDPEYAWSVQDEEVQEEMCDEAHIAIEAALPHIREALAQQIDDHAREDFQITIRRGDGSPTLRLAAFQQSARIVRGEP